jgi:hypothetical protein
MSALLGLSLTSKAGGLIGVATNTTIIGSCFNGNLSSDGLVKLTSNLGGIVGEASSTSIEASYSTGTIALNGVLSNAAGIVAVLTDSQITESYSTMNINSSILNLVGVSLSSIAANVSGSSSVTYSVAATGNINSLVSGLLSPILPGMSRVCGVVYSGVCSNNYASDDMLYSGLLVLEGLDAGLDTNDGATAALEDLYKEGFYTGAAGTVLSWDFYDMWKANTNAMPTFK